MSHKSITTILSLSLALHLSIARAEETPDSLTRELQEVIVTANQPATRLVGSTLVSTIAGTNLASLGNALDVLAQLPMITVTDDGVSVIGKNNVEIYIDGRPMRDGEELRRMLSSDIKRVELLMAPGAAYMSTTGAILKITTRRNFVKGLSVTDQFKLQRRRKCSVSDYLGLSYRSENWEAFFNGTINHTNTLSKGVTTNRLMYDNRETVVGASQHNTSPSTTGSVKAGFNYAGQHQSFGAYYLYNPERATFHNSGAEWLDRNPPINRDIDRNTRSHSHLSSLYYENALAGGMTLHFDGDLRLSSSRDRLVTSYPESTVSDIASTSKRKSTLVAGKLYLTVPLRDGELTVGTQDSYTHTSLDYRMLNAEVGEYIPSSLTDAHQTSAALYASWSRSFGALSLTAGARYEYVDYDFKVDGTRDKDVTHRSHLLTPDLSLGYFFNPESQLSLSYRMATIRPPYSRLTGSLNYVGMHEIEGGNPALADERMHDIQLFGTWKDFMLQADFIRSLDTYAYVKQLYPADNLQLLMHPVNIDVSALSLYLVWSRPVKRWTPNVTAGLYRQWLTLAGTCYNKPIFSYYFDNTISLPDGWMITANISGQTRGDMHTNRFGATWFTMDASVGKNFLNKSLNVKLSATDIFNTANNDWTMSTYGIYVDKRQSYDRRGVSLSIIYNFQPRKSRYKGTSAAEAEMKRL